MAVMQAKHESILGLKDIPYKNKEWNVSVCFCCVCFVYHKRYSLTQSFHLLTDSTENENKPPVH